ncbi:DinB family protein [Kribbella lupini]|uniref:DinB family protein n=1 Tax=Kribbella lupini TaxID=291602 RepID=A0ABP4LJQ6_9ACTN
MKDVGPPRTGADEKATLQGFLDYLRAAIAGKVAGVPEPQVRTPGVDSGTNLLGLVKHVTAVERFYLLGEQVRDWKKTFHAGEDETVDGVLAAYREVVERANAVIAGWTDLESSAGPRGASRRWVLVHLIEETGRHAGHADILREQLDGAVGR